MIPTAWQFALLALGAYRLTRLFGWDDFPPIAATRGWALGEEWVPGSDPGLPGKAPEALAVELRPAYRRPLLAHLVHCPFCLGWWISLTVYVGWLATPRWTLLVLVPFALSGAVGLIAKNLDP